MTLEIEASVSSSTNRCAYIYYEIDKYQFELAQDWGCLTTARLADVYPLRQSTFFGLSYLAGIHSKSVKPDFGGVNLSSLKCKSNYKSVQAHEETIWYFDSSTQLKPTNLKSARNRKGLTVDCWTKPNRWKFAIRA